MSHRKAPPNPKEMGIDFIRRSNYLNTLTPKESQILKLLSKRLNNKTIALRIHIQPDTLNMHLNHIYSKLACNNSEMDSRAHAILVYLGKEAEGED